MKRFSLPVIVILTVAMMLVLSSSSLAADTTGNSGSRFRTRLTGFEEVPSLSTPGRGQFSARLNDAETELTYTLTFSELVAPTTVAHIHLGQRGVAGGVSAFLCGGGNKPACPASGTVTGTIIAADIIGPAQQGIEPGEFAELIRAMRAGFTYANVHSTTFPAGEIRGQIEKD